MLLSRVAECVYWAGRYVERAEGTARLVKVHTELYLDLPKSAGLSWSPLLAVTGSGESFFERYDDATEEAVIGFLASNLDNPGSIVSSLGKARENLRSTRSVFPRAAWEVVNELHLSAMATRGDAVERRSRLGWMDHVMRRCQMLSGVLDGTMSHDDAYSFLEIGRFVERADMTTRVLDVQAGILVGGADLEPYADITWMSVLAMLCADQMFRRAARCGVSGPEALRFLLKDPQFPRSVECCLTQVSRALIELPHYEEPMSGCAVMQALLEKAKVEQLAVDGLPEYVDQLQRCLGEMHDLLADAYFRRSPTQAEPAELLVGA
jgi:uncharacterized alpha-E superfamily protein